MGVLRGEVQQVRCLSLLLDLSQSVDQVPDVLGRQFAVVAPLEWWEVSGGHLREEIPKEKLRDWKRRSWQCVPKFLEEILNWRTRRYWEVLFCIDMYRSADWSGLLSVKIWSVNKTSHHPRLVQIEEKEEKDDSDVQKFTVHELCLSDRADVILPCSYCRTRGA